jgi:phospholipid N-methyltransferase
MTVQPHPPTDDGDAPDWWLFFTKFIRQGTAIASVAPSSRWMALAMIRGIDFGRARCIVELGAGTGPVTAELLRRVGADCRVIIIERDPEFCQRLRRRFPRAEILEADACRLGELLDERGLGVVDHIISGLPLPSFAPPAREEILRIVGRRLAPGGTFRQLTEIPWVYQSLYRGFFEEVRFFLVPLNLPPGGVYICRGGQVV